jgi:hypothetical protein
MNWLEFFAVGSVGFWALVVLETGLLIFLIEWGRGVFATASLAVTMALLYFLGDVNFLGFVIHHPVTLVLGLVVYFAAGTVWSVAKWWLFVRDMRTRYDDLRADFCQEHNLDGTITEQLQPLWLERLESSGRRGRRIEIRPRARKHRGQVVAWMAYWPWSLAWTVLNDPVRKSCRIIYQHIHDYLQEISNNAFRGVEHDFPEGQEPRGSRPRLLDAPAAASGHEQNAERA